MMYVLGIFPAAKTSRREPRMRRLQCQWGFVTNQLLSITKRRT